MRYNVPSVATYHPPCKHIYKMHTEHKNIIMQLPQLKDKCDWRNDPHMFEHVDLRTPMWHLGNPNDIYRAYVTQEH